MTSSGLTKDIEAPPCNEHEVTTSTNINDKSPVLHLGAFSPSPSGVVGDALADHDQALFRGLPSGHSPASEPGPLTGHTHPRRDVTMSVVSRELRASTLSRG